MVHQKFYKYTIKNLFFFFWIKNYKTNRDKSFEIEFYFWGVLTHSEYSDLVDMSLNVA